MASGEHLGEIWGGSMGQGSTWAQGGHRLRKVEDPRLLSAMLAMRALCVAMRGLCSRSTIGFRIRLGARAGGGGAGWRAAKVAQIAVNYNRILASRSLS